MSWFWFTTLTSFPLPFLLWLRSRSLWLLVVFITLHFITILHFTEFTAGWFRSTSTSVSGFVMTIARGVLRSWPPALNIFPRLRSTPIFVLIRFSPSLMTSRSWPPSALRSMSLGYASRMFRTLRPPPITSGRTDVVIPTRKLKLISCLVYSV